MRINFGDILLNPIETLMDLSYKRKSHISSIRADGLDLVDKAGKFARDFEIRNNHYYKSRDYVVGKRAANMYGIWGFNDGKVVMGNYRNVGIELALQFATENKDKKLLKVLKRIEKYDKEYFEHACKKYDIAFEFAVSGKKDAEKVKKLEEAESFISHYIYRSYDELLDIRDSKKKYLNEFKSWGSKSEEHKKIEKEIELLDKLIHIKKSKRKKMLVAKRKEIKEIYNMAQKRDNSLYRRYSKAMRKAAKYGFVHHRESLSDVYEKARDIIRTLAGSVYVKYYDSDSEGTYFLETPEVEIREYSLKSKKEALVEKYYSNNKGKSL